MIDANRYRPEALATLYELEPDLRDVIVEGRADAHFYRWYLDCAGVGSEVQVFAVKDRVIIDEATVEENGNLIGERGRVLSTAKIVHDSVPGQKGGTFIADADYGPIGKDNFPQLDCLLYTDYGSLEVYAFNVRTIEKVLRVILRAPRTVDARAIVNGISKALRALFYARLVMRTAPGGASLIKKFAECCEMIKGELILDHESLLRRSFSNVQKSDRSGWDEKRLGGLYLQLTQNKMDEARKEMSGHDIAPLLVRYLKLTAPQVFKEDRKGFEDRDTMERALLGSMEFVDISKEPLFVALLSRVA